MSNMYEVKKESGQWVVKSTRTGMVQFRSLRRINCTDWVKLQTGQLKESE